MSTILRCSRRSFYTSSSMQMRVDKKNSNNYIQFQRYVDGIPPVKHAPHIRKVYESEFWPYLFWMQPSFALPTLFTIQTLSPSTLVSTSSIMLAACCFFIPMSYPLSFVPLRMYYDSDQDVTVATRFHLLMPWKMQHTYIRSKSLHFEKRQAKLFALYSDGKNRLWIISDCFSSPADYNRIVASPER